MTIDWNGDVLVCMQDWNKKIKFGNIHSNTLLEIWKNKIYSKYRMSLIKGSRKLSPCNKCNADGTLHGGNHANAWMNKKKTKKKTMNFNFSKKIKKIKKIISFIIVDTI